MSHDYKEERILVGCEDVSCCALYPIPDRDRLIGEQITIFPQEKTTFFSCEEI
jgi:hypothetical protein